MSCFVRKQQRKNLKLHKGAEKGVRKIKGTKETEKGANEEQITNKR